MRRHSHADLHPRTTLPEWETAPQGASSTVVAPLMRVDRPNQEPIARRGDTWVLLPFLVGRAKDAAAEAADSGSSFAALPIDRETALSTGGTTRPMAYRVHSVPAGVALADH